MRSLPRPILYSMLLLLFITVTSLALSGCGNGDVTTTVSTEVVGTTETSSPETTSSSVDTTTSSAVVTPSSESAGSTSSEQVLPNGNVRACGIIKEVWTDGGTRKIKIDYVDFLVGVKADAAAVADGVIKPGEHVENDYYVRNNNAKLRTFVVSGSAAITLDDRSLPPGKIVTISWSEFSGFWKLSGEEAWLSHSYWWIERRGDTVVRIEQQFVP